MTFYLLWKTKDISKDVFHNKNQWGLKQNWIPLSFCGLKNTETKYNLLCSQKKVLQVWNDMGVSKWWQNLTILLKKPNFEENIPELAGNACFKNCPGGKLGLQISVWIFFILSFLTTFVPLPSLSLCWLLTSSALFVTHTHTGSIHTVVIPLGRLWCGVCDVGETDFHGSDRGLYFVGEAVCVRQVLCCRALSPGVQIWCLWRFCANLHTESLLWFYFHLCWTHHPLSCIF